MQMCCICIEVYSSCTTVFRAHFISCLLGLLCWLHPGFLNGKPSVVTSFTIIQDWTQVIASDKVTIINLVPSHSETHGYQINPRDARELRRATLIVGMNPNLEPWLEAWAKANQRTDTLLWLYPEPRDHDARAPGSDPHAWTNPAEAKKMVRVLADRLAGISPEIDTENSYKQYVKEIDQVDLRLREWFAELPRERRAFVSQHANLGHFAARYGLRVPGTILTSSSAESADPSARHFSGLLALIRREQIKVIVTDAGQNDAFARRLTEDAGLPPPLALSFEYLEPAGRPGDTWLSMMLHNGRRLHEALRR